MKKRIIAIVLIVAMVVSFAGCGKKKALDPYDLLSNSVVDMKTFDFKLYASVDVDVKDHFSENISATIAINGTIDENQDIKLSIDMFPMTASIYVMQSQGIVYMDVNSLKVTVDASTFTSTVKKEMTTSIAHTFEKASEHDKDTFKGVFDFTDVEEDSKGNYTFSATLSKSVRKDIKAQLEKLYKANPIKFGSVKFSKLEKALDSMLASLKVNFVVDSKDSTLKSANIVITEDAYDLFETYFSLLLDETVRLDGCTMTFGIDFDNVNNVKPIQVPDSVKSGSTDMTNFTNLLPTFFK